MSALACFRRCGETETALFLTALPRGSFGLQLSQPHIEDFVAAANVSQAMLDLSALVEATVESDQAFETALSTFDARVFKPLKRFVFALHAGGGACRLVTGFRETSLSTEQITAAFERVSAANTDEEEVNLPGIFGGVLTFSCEFDFRPDGGELIRGPLAEEVSEATAGGWSQHFTHEHVTAKFKISTVVTRAGKKKPTYELVDLEPLTSAPPAPKDQK
mgnify:CR=1 FL=1